MLITITDIALIRPITQNISDLNSIEPYILEAEQIELKKLLGPEFYYSISKITADINIKIAAATTQIPAVFTAEEQIIRDLLNGKEYQNSKGNTVAFAGLKTVLAYFSYSRFILNDNMKHTNAGMVFKRTEYSEQPSAKAITDKAQDAKSMALSFWADVECFLNKQYLKYPLWKSDCNHSSTGIRSRSRITSVNNRRVF